MAAEFPQRLSLSELRSRLLPNDLAELIYGGDEAAVTTPGAQVRGAVVSARTG